MRPLHYYSRQTDDCTARFQAGLRRDNYRHAGTALMKALSVRNSPNGLEHKRVLSQPLNNQPATGGSL
jgi:hypothetical protein